MLYDISEVYSISREARMEEPLPETPPRMTVGELLNGKNKVPCFLQTFPNVLLQRLQL